MIINWVVFGLFCFALGYDLSRLQKKHIECQTQLLNSIKDDIKKILVQENESIKNEIRSLKK